MAKVTFKTDSCKGCGLCVEACPKKILVIAKDKIKESKKYDLLDLAQAERSLKKALNRLSLIK